MLYCFLGGSFRTILNILGCSIKNIIYIMKYIAYRSIQAVLRMASHVIPFEFPKLISGLDSLSQVGDLCREYQLKHVLVVSDQTLMQMKLGQVMFDSLDQAQVQYTIFDQTQANPSVENVEEALKLYQRAQCQGIIAFGGGSPMDCAKGVAARLARPHLTLRQMRGLLRVRKRSVVLFAIPTTAGTGSETTVAAVINDTQHREKYAISDPSLLPHVAILDPNLIMNLPPLLSAATGMDALTHAIEAYLGQSNTLETKGLALEAIHLIYQHLLPSVEHPQVLEHRMGMQRAAFLAGKAFTQAYVGYVHALAHGLGAFYGIPHGIANATLLPYVLKMYGPCIYVKLSEMAQVTGLVLTNDVAHNAQLMIDSIVKMNSDLNIPNQIEGILDEDIEALIKHAFKEAHPWYPVPRFLSKKELQAIYQTIQVST
jgi:alcohol dehydrogenase